MECERKSKDDSKIFAWAVERMDLEFIILQKNARKPGLREIIISSVLGVQSLMYLPNIQVEMLSKSYSLWIWNS